MDLADCPKFRANQTAQKSKRARRQKVQGRSVLIRGQELELI
jgi:hypothetical protein